MMKAILKQTSVVLMMAAALTGIIVTGCSSDELTSAANQTKGKLITIKAGLPSDAGAKPDTRISFEGDGNATLPGFNSKWTTTDALTVLTASNMMDPTKAKTFTLSSGAGTTTATFGGEDPGETTNGYVLIYPSSIKSMLDFLKFSFLGQEQDGNDKTNHLSSYFVMLKTATDLTNVNFTSEQRGDFMQPGCVKFELTMPTSIVPTSIVMTLYNGSSPVTGLGGMLESSNTNQMTLKLNNFNSTNQITAYMMMGSCSMKSSRTLYVSVTTAGTIYTKEFALPTNPFNLGKLDRIIVDNAADWRTDLNKIIPD